MTTLDIYKTTDFDCPYCGKSKLAPQRKTDHTLVMINGCSPEHRKYHETSSDGDETEVHTFALALECTNPECQMMTIVVGRLDAYPNYNGLLRKYDIVPSPRFFYPPVDIFPVPSYVPRDIREELKRSYALYFADPASAANPLRSAIECFMDATGTIKKSGERYLSLHKRLVEFNKVNAGIAELLVAIKWLGNDGSHSGHELNQDDLKKAYEVFLYVMDKWFDNLELRIKNHASSLAKGRGL